MLSRTRFEVRVLRGDQTRPSVGAGTVGWSCFIPSVPGLVAGRRQCRQIFLFLRLIPCFPTAVGQSRVLNHAIAMVAYSVI